MQYKTYLKSGHWADLRKKKITKQKNKNKCVCAFCWMSFKDVHHLVYKDLISVETVDLRLACRECHYSIHRLEKSWYIDYDLWDFKNNPHSKYHKQKHALFADKYWIFHNVCRVTWTYIKWIMHEKEDWNKQMDNMEMLKKCKISRLRDFKAKRQTLF